MYRQRTLLTAGSQRTRRTSRRTEMSNVFANHPSGEDSARHARCPVQEAVLPSSSRVRCSCRAGSTRSRERSRSPQRLGSPTRPTPRRMAMLLTPLLSIRPAAMGSRLARRGTPRPHHPTRCGWFNRGPHPRPEAARSRSIRSTAALLVSKEALLRVRRFDCQSPWRGRQGGRAGRRAR